MTLFVYAKPNVMTDHNFTDDVAICYANNIDEAVDKFNSMYDIELLKDNVKEANFNNYGICVCTSY